MQQNELFSNNKNLTIGMTITCRELLFEWWLHLQVFPDSVRFVLLNHFTALGEFD